jgi:hypothetical protein
MEVGFHELFVEIHFIEIPVRAKDNVHVIQASDLCPTKVGEEKRPRRNAKNNNIRISSPTNDIVKSKLLRSCVCGNDAGVFMI